MQLIPAISVIGSGEQSEYFNPRLIGVATNFQVSFYAFFIIDSLLFDHSHVHVRGFLHFFSLNDGNCVVSNIDRFDCRSSPPHRGHILASIPYQIFNVYDTFIN